jgi:peptide/nickel transport system ATP-binding protein
MTAPAALETRDLDVSYRRHGTDVPVLRGLTLSVAAGQTYGLVGESGCGKSTAAYAVARYLPRGGQVMRGSVHVDGHDVLRLSGDQLRRFRATQVAMVYQEPGAALDPTMRVGEQVAEVHVAGGVRPGAARSLAIEDLRRVALPDPERFAARYPHELSGGQQQRVVIAMALAVQPRLLILDEPTTGLDATVEAEVLDLVGHLQGEIGFGVLMISHNLPLVARICDRIGVLYAGRLVEEGPTETLLRSPLHPYTSGLLRCVPQLSAGKGTVRLQPIPGRVPPLGEVPGGCAFAARCSMATQACRDAEPALETVDDGQPAHQVRCFHPGSLEGRPQEPAPASRPHSASRKTGVPGKTAVSIEHLTRRYGTTVACEDVNLEIGQGEVLGLVGESGSGKTTLARCLSGLADYDGVIRVAGAVQAPAVERRSRRVRQELQMVFQQPDASLNPRRTASAILQRAIRRLGGHWTVEQLGDKVELDAATLRRRSGQLSGGQKQRVAIGRAFAGRPALVVCDEPVSALDVSVQASILALLSELQCSDDVSYLFISHDLGVVRYLADRIAVMFRGHIVEVGPADDVFTDPQHPYTRVLLAAVPRLDEPRPARPGSRAPVPASPQAGTPDPGPGCRFAGRCPERIPGLCDTIAPPWQASGPQHDVRCHLKAASDGDLRPNQLPPTEGPPP